MSDPISGLAAVEKIGGNTMTLDKTVDVDGYSAQTAQRTERAMMSMVEDALPQSSGTSSSIGRDQGMVDGSNGAVDDQKETLVSDPKQSNLDNAMLDQTTIATRKLYVELGRWNIAWGIAKRVQRDSNQIMRGQ